VGTIGQGYYNRNAVRAYPIADSASCVSDAGDLLPDDIIVDLVIRFPDTLGTTAVLSAITANARIVAAVFTVGNAPIAAISIPQPVEPGRHYVLDSLSIGVGGWIVFGPGALTATYNGHFTSELQAGLVPRAGMPYRKAPVASIGLPLSVPMTGLVTLNAGNDFVFTPTTIDLGDRTVDAISVSLSSSGTEGSNALTKYAGTCGARPEAGTCPKPGIQRFGPAVPDCDGVIHVTVRHASVIAMDDNHGFTIATTHQMATTCPPPRIPDAYGNLPGRTSGYPIMTAMPMPMLFDNSVNVEEFEVEGLPLPLHYKMTDAAVDPHWQVVNGVFEIRDDAWFAATSSRRCVAVLDGLSHIGSLDLRASTTFMIDDHDGNAGLVINYHAETGASLPPYHFALVNRRDNTYEIWHFTESGEVIRVVAVPFDPDYTGPGPFSITCETRRVNNSVALRAIFTSPAAQVVLPSVPLTRYGIDDGLFGICTLFSRASFLSFDIASTGV